MLAAFSQPLTVTQVARRAGLDADIARDRVRTLVRAKRLRCLNPSAQRCRLYFHRGRRPRVPRIDQGSPTKRVDWDEYGAMCFRHRAAILRNLTEPLQPATLRRRACKRDATLRMSANNVRNVIREFLALDIVAPVKIRRLRHLHYELAPRARVYQALLLAAEVPL